MTATYDFSVTRNQIIRRALRLTGQLGEGGEPAGDQMVTGAEALESLVKFLQAKGVNLWARENRTLALLANTAQYSLPLDTLNIEALSITDSTGVQTTVPLISDAAFATIAFPTQTGKPSMANVNMYAQPLLFVWPIPEQAYTLQYKATRKTADFDTALGTPEAPQRWYDPLCYLLAANLADEYGLALERCMYLRKVAEQMQSTASQADTDPADALFINPI